MDDVPGGNPGGSLGSDMDVSPNGLLPCEQPGQPWPAPQETLMI